MIYVKTGMVAFPESCERCDFVCHDPLGMIGCAASQHIILLRRGQQKPDDCPLVFMGVDLASGPDFSINSDGSIRQNPLWGGDEQAKLQVRLDQEDVERMLGFDPASLAQAREAMGQTEEDLNAMANAFLEGLRAGVSEGGGSSHDLA